jgi:HPt (histidine-containing phosphotransfer) domain-containing protein
MIAAYLPKHKLDAIEKEDEETGIYQIDKKKAMEYCGNDVGIYKEMVEEYLDQGDDYRSKLEMYYNERDWKNYRTVIHALKNTSLLVGAVSFSEKAKMLEHAASDVNEEILLKECESFHEEYGMLLDKIQKMKE